MNRKTVTTTVAAGLLIAGLPPAVAAAAPDASCAQWGFNGTTFLNMAGGGSVSFDATGPSIPQFPKNMATLDLGSPVAPVMGLVTGGIGSDGQIAVTFTAPAQGNSGPSNMPFVGQVNPDGSAHGAGWQMGPQLKCMSNATSETPSA